MPIVSSPSSPLIGWYKAGVGVFLDAGGGVYQWNDLSGNGNHLTQSNAANRPICNNYSAVVTSSGPASIAPFGAAQSLDKPSLANSLLFDGSSTFLNLPSSIALPATGCTVLLCTRGPNYSPISFGTDGATFFNYAYIPGTPGRMAIFDGSVHAFAKVTYLPTLTRIVHGFRASPAQTRLYVGTNQISDLPYNPLQTTLIGGAIGRTLGVTGAYGNFSFTGEIFEIAIYNTPLTDAEVQTALIDMQAAHGIRDDANSNQVIFIGDSLTTGGPAYQAVSHCYPWKLCDQNGGAFKPMLLAVPGHAIAQQQALATAQLNPLDLTPFDQTIAVVCCGINDAIAGRSATQIAADLASLCMGLRAMGIKVLIATIPPTPSVAGVINAVNATIRAGRSAYADALIDWAGDPRLVDPTNTVYFASNHLDGTDAGEAVKASLVQAVLEPLLNPGAAELQLSQALFYAGGRNFDGAFGRFVRS